MDSSPSDEAFAHLTRLAQKPGVQSTLILSRENGAIVRANGLISAGNDIQTSTKAPTPNETLGDGYGNGAAAPAPTESTALTAEEVAKLVWGFVNAAGTLVEGLEGGDGDVKLLRVRSRKNELVIVPDPKYLLVVIHDTPPA